MRVIFDSNILVYAVDRQDPRHASASDLIARAVRSDCRQTLQSLAECKVENYSRLPSINEILLVSSEERRVRTWRRDGRRWIVEDLIGEAELRLKTVTDPIPLAAIYDGSGVAPILEAPAVPPKTL